MKRAARLTRLVRWYWMAALVFAAGAGLVTLVGLRTESLVAIMYTSGILGVIFGIAIGAANRKPKDGR